MSDWEAIVVAKTKQRDAQIPASWRIPQSDVRNVLGVPSSCGLLSGEEIRITECSATVLIERMLNGSIKSEDVTRAFCKRAAIAHNLTNCLTEVLFDVAIARAKKIDATYQRTGSSSGPLHGLPVSLKDTFRIEGLDTTIGFVAFSNAPETSETESEITKIMRNAGAVLYCKTNVPTGMMMSETYNNLWGYTSNPHNRDLGAGGSSGGEAALLALHGSPLGVGTDIGGSIRIPAAFCGIYSLKPSFGRFPTLGSRSGLVGQEAVRGVNGPMSAHLDSLELWAKAVVWSEPWLRDPYALPIRWRDVTLDGKLCFGIIRDNEVIKPTPPVERGLTMVADALRAAGHEVIDWTPYQAQRSMTLLEQLFSGDGGRHIHDTIEESGEPWAGLALFKEAYDKAKDKPALASDLWRLQAERANYAKQALARWQASSREGTSGRPFDAIISPVTPWPACPKYKFGSDVSYTSMWNLLDQPAVTFPVTRASLEDTKPDYTPRNLREKFVWDNYHPAELIGAPVSLQVIGQRLEEEKTLAAARVIVNAIQ